MSDSRAPLPWQIGQSTIFPIDCYQAPAGCVTASLAWGEAPALLSSGIRMMWYGNVGALSFLPLVPRSSSTSFDRSGSLLATACLSDFSAFSTPVMKECRARRRPRLVAMPYIRRRPLSR